MPCTTNSAHAQHTFLRGCCQSSCPCPGISSYQAGKYCECNDTIAQNQVLLFSQKLCNILETLRGSYINDNLFIDAINSINYTAIRCGTYNINIDGPTNVVPTNILMGVLTNGVFVLSNPLTIPPGTYDIVVNNLSCSITIIIN